MPSLQIDGETLTESLAIIEYLEETRPEPSFFPKDPKTRAKVRIIAETINSGIQPLINLNVGRKIENELKSDKKAWNQSWIELGFDGYSIIIRILIIFISLFLTNVYMI